MPTSAIIIGTVIGVAVVRSAVTGQGPFAGLMQSLGKLLHYISDLFGSAKAGSEYTHDKIKTMERDERQQVKEVAKEEKRIEKEMKQQAYEEKEKEVKQAISERQDAMKAFIPSNWNNANLSERVDASIKLIEQMEKNMHVSNHYNLKFAQLEDNTSVSVGDNNTIILNANLLSSNEETASLDVFKHIVKTMAYARQEEILNGESQPSDRERAIMPMVLYERENKPECISIPKIFFLGNRINQINDVMSSPYIQANDNDTYERQAISGLQAAERLPNMAYSINFAQFKSIIESEPFASDAVKKKISEMDKFTYFSMRDSMNKLYGCKNIESEIDKAMSINDSTNFDKPQWFNKQVHYAVSMYQAQTYNEINGEPALADERIRIVESMHHAIPEVSEKQYRFDKGRFEYEGIHVGRVVPDEEWQANNGSEDESKKQKPNPKKEENKPKKNHNAENDKDKNNQGRGKDNKNKDKSKPEDSRKENNKDKRNNQKPKKDNKDKKPSQNQHQNRNENNTKPDGKENPDTKSNEINHDVATDEEERGLYNSIKNEMGETTNTLPDETGNGSESKKEVGIEDYESSSSDQPTGNEDETGNSLDDDWKKYSHSSNNKNEPFNPVLSENNCNLLKYIHGESYEPNQGNINENEIDESYNSAGINNYDEGMEPD